MPGLEQILQGAKTSWADQIQKEEIENVAFWIHNATESSYEGEDGREVHLIICDVTVGGSSRKDPRAVITFGYSEERAPMLAYFAEGQNEPIGPCVTYKVGMKGGMSFWRLEPAPDPDDAESFVQYQPGENGTRKKRR